MPDLSGEARDVPATDPTDPRPAPATVDGADLRRAVAHLADETMRTAQHVECGCEDCSVRLARLARRMLALVPDVPPDGTASPASSPTADPATPGGQTGHDDTQETSPHHREIGNRFDTGAYFEACSCGWESDTSSPSLRAVQRDTSGWNRHITDATETGADHDHT